MLSGLRYFVSCHLITNHLHSVVLRVLLYISVLFHVHVVSYQSPVYTRQITLRRSKVYLELSQSGPGETHTLSRACHGLESLLGSVSQRSTAVITQTSGQHEASHVVPSSHAGWPHVHLAQFDQVSWPHGRTVPHSKAPLPQPADSIFRFPYSRFVSLQQCRKMRPTCTVRKETKRQKDAC